MTITLSYLEEENLFRLEGEVHELRNNRTFWFFLNSSFSIARVDDSTIDIDVIPEELESIYAAIEEYLIDLGYKVERDSKAQSSLDKVLKSIEDFELYSQKAKEIYWGKINKHDLKDFLSHIDNSFISGRKLDHFLCIIVIS